MADHSLRSAHHDYRIGLYYSYLPIDDVETHILLQKQLCSEKDLKGRVRVSSEGINGVLSGRTELLEDYERVMQETLSQISGEQTFEFDIKYCCLREDLGVEAQLFKDLLVQKTSKVISLVEFHQKQEGRKSKRIQNLNASLSNEKDSDQVVNVWKRALEQLELTGSTAAAEHLSPQEWNERLGQLSSEDNAILLDCRNFYESNIGHFVCPKACTLLTNTRKYQELPVTLLQQKERLASSKKIFMYCTGGVRCERAGAYLKAMLDEAGAVETEVYQLHGGIQRYIEHVHSQDAVDSFFRGKNFVFDPRRIDPLYQEGDIVGSCLLCGKKHDDYDNGHAPCENRETRCCTCRILILVCISCRQSVACWGDESSDKQQVYCGLSECLHKPDPKDILVTSDLQVNKS